MSDSPPPLPLDEAWEIFLTEVARATGLDRLLIWLSGLLRGGPYKGREI